MMIRVSVLYPQGPAFDWDYYLNKHVPLVREKLGKALKGLAIDKGVAGGTPGSAPGYCAMFHMNFDSVDAFQAAFGPHAKTLMADIPNYTKAQPAIQISEVKA